METPRPPSFFEDLKLREVNGFRVKKRPYPTNEMRDLDPAGAVAVEHRGEPSPPMSLSFGKTSKNGHILALTDEGGYVNLFDTRKRFVDSSSYQENAEKAKVSEWVGHNNAIFDLCWNKEKRHGISSLSQDLNGVFVTASCMDHRIYLYNVLQLEKGPAKTFSGGRTESFFVKSAISPDAAHILSGSSDGNAYIWQVNKPQCDPIILKSHDGEVTAVDWCPSETGKVATCSDDFTVRFWNIKTSCYSSTRSPSSMRKRVRTFPKIERKKLFLDGTSCTKTDLESTCLSETCHVDSPQPNRTPEVSTPESMKKKFSLSFEVKENLYKTPEAEYSSPSSVLNPPSSLKRKTIRDYFPVS
ncbi:transducin/WD40 repeat-like superfamily protein [Striga asiatica]|uniref:Transducin/WD40 repeat-like superfamily protein n=1 Tax=Striga asiatica TaxID=4170 RepID=A0A5A7QRV0_STRAF|nr:transducin/WD40 repeat-like superfamily protein [Striga asiatica]